LNIWWSLRVSHVRSPSNQQPIIVQALRPTPWSATPPFCFQVLEVAVLGDGGSEIATDGAFVLPSSGLAVLYATDFSFGALLG